MNNYTPCYQYDLSLLEETLDVLCRERDKYGYEVHYAIKANNNDRILSIINSYGLGADCVSGNEIRKALAMGFDNNKIVFAGVGKTDDEISLALHNDILCFNCESFQEIKVINKIASYQNKTAKIALRINPDVDANTHKHITTGLNENKFGINIDEIYEAIELIRDSDSVQLVGLHFHIGSQITDLSVFQRLASKINSLNQWCYDNGHQLEIINVGGGLGIDYENPVTSSIPDFSTYFRLFHETLELFPEQKVHFELGRSIVAQCGSLLTKVIYTKDGVSKKFAIVDGGMTELMRPALYQAYHTIENLSSTADEYYEYDVVGPVCETADSFGEGVRMPLTQRGDLIAIRSAGAYGEVMASRYNLRELNPPRFVHSEVMA